MKQYWNKIIIGCIFFIILILWLLFEYKLNNIYQENYTNRINFLTNEWTLESQIPNIIWTFWDGDVSPFVSRCIQSWKHHNPNYKIIVLNKENIGDYLPEVDFTKIRAANDFIQRYSDYVRIHVLSKYGGFWFDASIICQASNQWIHDIQNKTGSEYIGYYIDRATIPEYVKSSPIIENWCFACIPGSIFVKDWLDEFMKLNHYENTKQYVDAVLETGVNPQKIDSLEYLTMHLSAQKILQNNPNKYKLYLLRAEDTAFRHLVNDNSDWDGDENGARRILEKTHPDQPLLKLIGMIRDQVIDECAKQNIDIETLFI